MSMSSLFETEQFTGSTAVDPLATLRASLRFYLLGPPSMEWAGHPLVIPRR
jgi:hypothetical protein